MNRTIPIKVRFELQEKPDTTRIDMPLLNYPVPFSVIIGKGYPATPIYTRNITAHNFTEFRFNKETKKLYDINIVLLEYRKVQTLPEFPISKIADGYYDCFLEADEEIEMNFAITNAYRVSNGIYLNWTNEPITYFKVNNELLIGITENQTLSSIIILGFSNEMMNAIFNY